MYTRTRMLLILMITTVLLAVQPAHAGNAKLNAAINKMKKLVYQPLDKWQMTKTMSQDEVLGKVKPSGKFQKAGIGYFWADAQEIWIRTKYEVPESIVGIPIAGTKIALSANVEDWGEIFVNGESVQTFRRSTGYYVLTENAQPGETYYIAMKIRRKSNDTGLLRDINLQYGSLTELDQRVGGFVEAAQSIDILLAASGKEASEYEDILNQAADAIDIDALENGQIPTFYASLEKCYEILMPVSELIKEYSMLLVGYSHIDPAWLWDKAEGEHIVWKGTSEQILDLQKDYPDFVYVANQMHCYRWMEKDYPELFEGIKQAIAEGRWEPTGAEWVEPDGNLPHGESFVRQFFYGRKYSKEKFDFISTIGLTPDSFGYNWSMPQILAKSDMRGFVTQKISWNDTTHFPYNLFWWESPDGTRILVYFPQGSYGERVEGMTMATQLANMKHKHGVDSNLVIFGIGDHGGGIPRDYVKRAYALRTNPLFPNIEFLNFEQVFDRMLEKSKTIDFPVWDTELYLEYHRGTYTSQANTKNNNRRNEHCLMNAEKFNTAAEALAGSEYPFDKIEEAWKILLFNQFHDILPGSSITPVYKDADADYAWIANECEGALNTGLEALAKQADTTGDGAPYVLFNSLSWARDDVVEIPVDADQAAVFDADGAEVPAQVVSRADGTKTVLFVAREVPATGYAVYHVKPGVASGAAAGELKITDTTIENEFLKIEIDPKTGWVSSITDKKNGRDVVAPGQGGAFQLQAHQEDGEKADAWDPRPKPSDDNLMPMPDAEKVSVTERGPVRAMITSERKFGEKSNFRQHVWLVAGVPIVFARLDTDWYDSNIFLKSAFPMNFNSDYVTYEIPYTTIQRSTKRDTLAESAQWEVSGHRWVDYPDQAGDYGATLLSWSKYGYDALGNVLRMSMLRSPVRPDPEADKHPHSIPYALYPHAGDWTAADSALRGREYNTPVIVLQADAHSGPMGRAKSLFSVNQDNVVIVTMKKADDGEGYIIRLVETEGRDGEATINLPAAPRKVEETNLVERKLNDITAPAGPRITVPVGHYEIKSLRVVF